MIYPSWLPTMLDLDGEWEKKLITLYQIFTEAFKSNRTEFNHFPVIFDTRKIDSKFEEGFWHLITKGEPNDRCIDYRRAERLPWCSPTIEHATLDPEILVWNFRDVGKNRIRTYIWLKKYDYLVILEKRKKVAFLVTAYYIDGKSTKSKLEKKYRKRI